MLRWYLSPSLNFFSDWLWPYCVNLFCILFLLNGKCKLIDDHSSVWQTSLQLYKNFFRGKKNRWPRNSSRMLNRNSYRFNSWVHWNRACETVVSTFYLHFPFTVAQKWKSSTSWSRSFPPLFYDGQQKKREKERNEKNRVGGGPSFISAYPSPIHRATKVIHPKCYKHWGLLMLINISVGKLLCTETPVLYTVSD